METYDEFALLSDNATEVGLPADTAAEAEVRRVEVAAPSGHDLSAIVWGSGPAEIVFLHGGAQNAHTWDTTVLALGLPVVAIDLPGHGHSAWRDDKAYLPEEMADDVAFAIETLAPEATTLIGMSLGGLTAVSILVERPELADRLLLVDITPGVDQEKAEPIISFVSGPEEFESFDALLERTMAFNPTRTESSLRRGLLHNARPQHDGTWVWRYDLLSHGRAGIEEHMGALDSRFTDLWDALGSLTHPILLLRGSRSGVVDDDDVAELLRRQPTAQVDVVQDAGHSIQGDQPVELAERIRAFHRL
jgi:pimeloyl-ACP methyl ester carboxylesterase